MDVDVNTKLPSARVAVSHGAEELAAAQVTGLRH